IAVVEDRATADRSRVALFAVGLEAREEEQLVLDDRTAGVDAVGGVAVLAGFATVVQLAREGGVGIAPAVRQGEVRVVGVDLVFAHALRHVDDLATEFPLVGTALADLADHAAGRTAVTGAVAADVGFLLLD